MEPRGVERVREVRAVGRVLLLSCPGAVDQENAGPAVAQEDGYRVVVGLATALDGRRYDGVSLTAAPPSVLPVLLYSRHNM